MGNLNNKKGHKDQHVEKKVSEKKRTLEQGKTDGEARRELSSRSADSDSDRKHDSQAIRNGNIKERSVTLLSDCSGREEGGTGTNAEEHVKEDTCAVQRCESIIELKSA